MQPPDDTSRAADANEVAPPLAVQDSVALEKANSQEAQMRSRPQDVTDTEKAEPASDTAAANVEPEYPPFWKLVLLTIALCMAMLVVSLVSRRELRISITIRVF